MSWSAQQYVAFEDERTRPARDLLAAIPLAEARSVIDIGCGPGNSTELLVQRFPGAGVSGLDSSADMIEAARKRLPQLQFEVGDIDQWADEGRFDVIFANAVLQWVPDHAALLPALADCCGRLIRNQMPTGVEVCSAMHHGGPFPASTGLRFTAVGTAAYQRFVRPLCWQNFGA